MQKYTELSIEGRAVFSWCRSRWMMLLHTLLPASKKSLRLFCLN